MTEPAASTCPKCGRPRPSGAAECAGCGVIFARYRPNTGPVKTVLVAPPAPAEEPRPYVAAASAEAFATALAESLDSGLPMATFVQGSAMSALPTSAAARLRRSVALGEALPAALRAAGVLDGAGAALVEAYGAHGGFPAGLRLVAARIANARRHRMKLLMGLAYPAFIVLAAIFVIPAPVLFSCNGGAGAYLARVLPPLGLFVGALVFGLAVLPRLPPEGAVRTRLSAVARAVPLAGGAMWNGAVAGFVDALGACLSAGLPARQAIDLAFASASHPRIAASRARAAAVLEAGGSLAQAIGTIPGMPPLVTAQFGAAEVAGRLDVVLPRIGQDLQQRSQTLALFAVGVVAGVVLVAVMGAIAFHVVSGWSQHFSGQARGIEAITGQ